METIGVGGRAVPKAVILLPTRKEQHRVATTLFAHQTQSHGNNDPLNNDIFY